MKAFEDQTAELDSTEDTVPPTVAAQEIKMGLSRSRQLFRWAFVASEATAVGVLVLAFGTKSIGYLDSFYVLVPLLALPFLSVGMLYLKCWGAGILGLLTTGLTFIILLGSAVARGC